MNKTTGLKRLWAVLFLCCALEVAGFAQNTGWQSLCIDELPVAVSKCLRTQFAEVEAIDDLMLSCNDSTDFSVYRSHYRCYRVRASVDEVWCRYLDADLKSAWSGKAISYGFAYSRPSDAVFTDDHANALKPNVGLGMFLELTIAKLIKIPVAFEVTRIDRKDKFIEFTYLRGNKTNGRQTIAFRADGEHETLIVHHTYFRGDSEFRDRYFYGPFHTDLIDQFHGFLLQDFGKFQAFSPSKVRGGFLAAKNDTVLMGM